MPEGQTITARISISRSQLHRLAAVAMNPVTRAAIASATVALDRAAWDLYNGGGRVAEVRLDFVEQRVSAMRLYSHAGARRPLVRVADAPKRCLPT